MLCIIHPHDLFILELKLEESYRFKVLWCQDYGLIQDYGVEFDTKIRDWTEELGPGKPRIDLGFWAQ